MEPTFRPARGDAPGSGRRIRMFAALLAVLTFAAFAASCSSGSSDESKSGKDSGASATAPAQQVAVTPEGAEAAVAKYVEGEGHGYAGDCAAAELPRDKGTWCSTLVSGDDSSGTKVYAVGPVGEDPVSRVTVTRHGSAQLTPGVQVAVADGSVGVPRELTSQELLADTFITGNLILDQAAGIGNGLADLPPGAPGTGDNGGTGDPGGGGGDIVGTPVSAPTQYPPRGNIVVVDPNVDVGGEAVFRGGGCEGGEALQVLFDGQPVGTVNSDAEGNFAGSISIPPGTAPGIHGLTIKGAACVLDAAINVRGALAFTGASSHTTNYVLVGFAAVTVGLVLVVGTRRRRSARGRQHGPHLRP